MFISPNTTAPVVQLLNATVPITRFNKGEAANRNIHLIQTKESEEKRKAFIAKIRTRAVPPLEPQISPEKRKELMDSIGPINIDEEAVNELRRISTL